MYSFNECWEWAGYQYGTNEYELATSHMASQARFTRGVASDTHGSQSKDLISTAMN